MVSWENYGRVLGTRLLGNAQIRSSFRGHRSSNHVSAIEEKLLLSAAGWDLEIMPLILILGECGVS